MADGRGLQKGNAALSIEQDIDLEALHKDFLVDHLPSGFRGYTSIQNMPETLTLKVVQ